MSDDRCVWCGAKALRGLDGEIISWSVRWGSAAPHEHELIDGEGHPDYRDESRP